MFGKGGSKWLVWLVVGLAAAWFLFDRYGHGSSERSFKSSLLQTDTTAITGFSIRPAPKKHAFELRFARKGSTWTVTANERTMEVDPARIHALFHVIGDLRTLSVVGKWEAVKERYDLSDSTADVLVIETAKGATELSIGRMMNSAEFSTAVHPQNDDQVYAVAGQLGEWVDLPQDGWIPKYLVRGDPANWTKLTFTFPTDTGYAMVNTHGQWSIDGAPCDSARVLSYLESLGRSQGQSVVAASDTIGARRAFQLVVEDRTLPAPTVVTVLARPDAFVAISSLNPAIVMPFDARREVPRMFRPRTVFLKH